MVRRPRFGLMVAAIGLAAAMAAWAPIDARVGAAPPSVEDLIRAPGASSLATAAQAGSGETRTTAAGARAAEGPAAPPVQVPAVRPWFERFALPPGSEPWSIAVGPDGTVWTVLSGTRQLAALDPDTGRWRRIPVPRGVQPARLAVDGANQVWLTDNHFGRQPGRRLWRYRPDRDRWDSLALPFAGAAAILADHRGSVWLAQFQGNRVARLDPRSGRVQVWTLPLPEEPWSSVWDLALDPRGAVWTVSPRTGVLYRLDPGTGAVRAFPLPADVDGPAGLAVTAGGDAVWVTEHGGRAIGVLDTATGAWTESWTPQAPPGEEIRATRPNDLEWDAQGQLWAALHTGNALVRLDPSSATLRWLPFPAGESRTWVQWLAAGPDGSLWFAAFGRDYVGRVRPERLGRAQLTLSAAAQRLRPGAATEVFLEARVQVDPPRSRPAAAQEPAGGGGSPRPAALDSTPHPVEWRAWELPTGWRFDWTAGRSTAPQARGRLILPRDAEPGLYHVLLGTTLSDGTWLVRTWRVAVIRSGEQAWATVGGWAGMVAALALGWLGVAADLRRRGTRVDRPERHARRGGTKSPP